MKSQTHCAPQAYPRHETFLLLMIFNFSNVASLNPFGFVLEVFIPYLLYKYFQ